MKFDWEKIKQKNTVINCKTEEQAKLLFEFLKEKGITWASKSPSTFWYDEKEKTCYNVDGIYLSYDSNEYFLNNNYTILEFEDVVIQDKPKICEILGVNVGQKFNIKGKKYSSPFYLSEAKVDGSMFLYNNNGISDNGSMLTVIINNPSLIEIIPEYTDEQKEIFKALRVLGFKYIAKDKSNDVVFYTNKPYRIETMWDIIDGDYSEIPQLLTMFPFVNWGDKEPFEIPEI